MNNFFLGCLWLLATSLAIVGKNVAAKKTAFQHYNADSCTALNALNIKVRDGLIKKQDAPSLFKTLLLQTKAAYYKNGGKDYPKKDWVFPLQGYNAKATGGINGNGYSAAGYDFFDGNRHKGHPAYDIFIHDKNQDGTDDNTKKPVNVVSITGGMVIAIEKDWDTASSLRGGKYILVYDPATASLTYYAHNAKLHVGLCSLVKPGDLIAEVGRTGFNAFKKRSPTHLHVMQLALDTNNYPRPVAFYKELNGMKSLK